MSTPPYRQGDEVYVSGRITSEGGHRVSRLRAVVATVDTRDGFFKVWPADDRDPQLPPGHNGKFWFDGTDPGTVVELIPEPGEGL